MEKVVKVNAEDLSKEPKRTSISQDQILDVNPDFSHTKSNMSPRKENQKSKIFAIFVVVILLGVATGYGASKVTAKPMSSGSPLTGSNTTKTGNDPDNAGVADESAFPDTAQGVLKQGGIDGEGTHYLDRGTGKEKYVYLTSTVINLDNFIGKKVEVHGQTLAGKKAGWLMDVGRVKVLE